MKRKPTVSQHIYQRERSCDNVGRGNSLRQWTFVPKVSVFLDVHLRMGCSSDVFAESGIPQGNCQGWCIIFKDVSYNCAMTQGESWTFLWALGGVYNSVYSGFALSMGFVFLIEKKKIGGKFFHEFFRVLLEMKTHNVILCSYCCFCLSCQSLDNLGNSQCGFKFPMNQQILILKVFVLTSVILYCVS